MVKVAIDIGHGSNTFPSGGKGVYRNGVGYAEHDFNSKVAEKLKAKLEASGVTVVYGLQKPYSPDVALASRTNWYNSNGIDVVISIHANAGAAAASGICAFYWHTSSKAKNLAQNVIDQIKSKGYNTHGNGLHAGKVGEWTNMHINRETTMPAVLVEHGFMTNANDFVNIFGSNQDKYTEDMADADARGICAYLGISYKGDSVSGVNTTAGSSNAGATKIKDEWWGFELTEDIEIHSAPSKSAELVFTGGKGDVIDYDSVYAGNGCRWLSYMFEGQRVYLPYRKESEPNNVRGNFVEPSKPKPAKQAETYTVQSGDTLSGIAEDFGTSAKAIAEENNIDNPDLLSVGQELKVVVVEEDDHEHDDDSDFKSLNVGDVATIGTWATQYETGENISDWIKGTKLEVADMKDVEGTKSDVAYKLLNGDTVVGWVLAQDIVEADNGQRTDEIQKMAEQEAMVEEGKAEVVEEKTIEEAKEEEKNGEETYELKANQFVLKGKKYEITKANVD